MFPLSGSQAGLGVQFKPLGARKFLPFSLQELERHHYFPLADIFPDADALHNRLEEAPAVDARVQLVESFLIDQLDLEKPHDHRMEKFLRLVAREGCVEPIDRVAKRCYLSQRQLQRTCLNTLGVSPYRFSRIVRFLYACRHMGRTARRYDTYPVQDPRNLV